MNGRRSCCENRGLSPIIHNLGNLTSKAKADNSDSTTYTWDTRNKLTAIAKTGANAITASFKYDELGRRIERTVTTNGGMPDTTRFVYDGSQAVLEIRNTETASILTGLGIDEVIARYTAAGARTYLADALGSVIAMGKDDQSIATAYGYSPYGETSQTNQPGETTSNANQYTARENDNTGLYFYRARYYDPVLKRFIAEDPIGLSGGVNQQAYVGGNPVRFVDPEGKFLFEILEPVHVIVAYGSTGIILGAAALAAGYTAGTLFNYGFEAIAGDTVGNKIYDFVNPPAPPEMTPLSFPAPLKLKLDKELKLKPC